MPAVVDHFVRKISQSKMTCKLCDTESLFRSLNEYLTSLKRHLSNKHPETVAVDGPSGSKFPKISDFCVPKASASKFPPLSKLYRVIIAIFASSHGLPFNIVEDEFFGSGFEAGSHSRQQITDQGSKLTANWRTQLVEFLRGKFCTIMLDGWTNNISGVHHICFMVSTSSSVYFWSSVDCKDKSADNISSMTKRTVHELTEKGAIILGALADNAANMQKSLKLLNRESPSIINCGCVAHILNLVMADVFRSIENVAKAVAKVDELVTEGAVPRNSHVRWNSKFETLKKYHERNLGTTEDQAIFSQAHLILDVVAKHIMIIQCDKATVKEVIQAFLKIRQNWSLSTLPVETRSELETIFMKRWKMFSEGLMGNLTYYFQHFLELTPESEVFLSVYRKNDPQKATQWLRCILLESRYEDFEKEKEEFCDTQVLEAPLNVSNFPNHKTYANLILKMPVTEAAVEQAFFRHKIVHTRLRANLRTENLETQLLIRYNFERIFKIASKESKTEDVEGEILTWLCNVDID